MLLLALLSCKPESTDKHSDPQESTPILDTTDTGCDEVWYPDGDGDGYGDVAAGVPGCGEQPEGYIEAGGDCDDANVGIHPGAGEVPRDRIDQDCDGLDECLDLNCDGFLDIVASVPAGLLVYYGTRDAGYATRVELGAAGSAVNAIADVNDDGWPDLVSGGMGGETVIFFGGADDAFTTQAALAMSSVRGLAVADLDGDGLPEVAAGQDGIVGTEEGLTIYWNGGGYAEDQREVLPSIGARGVTAADLDGDGDRDLAVSNGGERHSWIYWNRLEEQGGAGAVAAGTLAVDALFDPNDRQELATAGAAGVAAADLDQDGRVDIVFAADAQGGAATESRIYWGRAGGFLEADSTALAAGSAAGVGLRDVDGDGYMDVVLSGGRVEGGAVEGPEGPSAPSAVYWGSSSRYSDGDHIALETAGVVGNSVADLDGDSWADLIFAGAEGVRIWWGPSWPYNPSEVLDGSGGAAGVSAGAGEQGL